MTCAKRGALTVAALSAAAVSAAVAPIVRRLMIRADVMDLPNDRSSHEAPVPRGGGWACVAGTATGLVVARGLGLQVPWRAATGALVLGLIGFADDYWSVSATPRLVGQGIVGALAGIPEGTTAFGLMLVPSVVNAVNFMDGINGISVLTAGVWGANAITTDNEHVRTIGAVFGGAMLGFLPYNLSSRRMLLGDVGSYFMGGMIALTALLHSKHPKSPDVSTLMPLSIYFAGTATTLLLRGLRGEDLFSAHREHSYQKLANERGWGHVPVALYAATSALVTGILTRSGRPWIASAIVAAYLAAPFVTCAPEVETPVQSDRVLLGFISQRVDPEIGAAALIGVVASALPEEVNVEVLTGLPSYPGRLGTKTEMGLVQKKVSRRSAEDRVSRSYAPASRTLGYEVCGYTGRSQYG